MTLYAGEDFYGTEGGGEHYGAYLGTSATSHEYAFASNSANHPLSYDPSQAEIVEVRFKTEDLAVQAGKNPHLVLMAVQETDGVTSANSKAYVPFTIQNGQWQTVRIPLNEELKSADYLKSLGLRFRYTRNQTSGSYAKIVVDYIYMGKEAEAPSKIFIGFTNQDTDKERYLSQTYGNVNLDVGGWSKSSRIGSLTFSSSGEGTMKMQMAADATQGVFYVQASPNINNLLTMEYDTKNAEIVQFRFKLKNFKAYSTPVVGLYFYSTKKSHPLGSDSIRNTAVNYQPTAEELNRDTYITVTFPVSDAVKAAERITALRLSLNGMESISTTQLGEITVDYIYVGPKAFAPSGTVTATFLDAEGNTLATETVVKGTDAVYTGTTPVKAATAEAHYRFLGWDKPLEAVWEDTVYTAQFAAEAHVFAYSNVTAEGHTATCACGYAMTTVHSFADGICACGEKEHKEPVENASLKLNHSLNLASDISVNLVIPKTALAGFDMSTVYVESVIDRYTGNEQTGTKVLHIEPVENGNYYYFTVTGLTAIHMNDRIRSVLYGTKDGQPYYSPVDDYAVADYAYAVLNMSSGEGEVKTLCADLLRYGAKAQIYKNYRTDALADAKMTEGHKACLSDLEAVTFGNNNRILADVENASVTWAGKTLNLDSKVELKFVFNPANYAGEVSDLTLRVSYQDIEGKTKSFTVENAELYSASMGVYAFTVDTLLAAELRAVVSVQVYAGDTPVSCTLQFSADTYGNNQKGDLLTLCKALMAYSDSAKAYFVK